MKKNLLYVLTLICSMSLFTACSDDDEEKDPIVGTWKVVLPQVDDTDHFVSGAAFMTWEAPADAILGFLSVSDIPPLAETLGSAILPQVLKDVTFRQDGKIVATYSSAGIDISGDNPITPVWQTSPANYATYKLQGNGKMLLFLNLEEIMKPTGKADMSAIDQLMALVTNGIPVNYSIADDKSLKVSIDKTLLVQLAALAPALAGMIPDDPDALGGMGAMLKSMLASLPDVTAKTTKFEFGLKFEK